MKKILSLLLAVIMVVSLLPTAAFAAVTVNGESKGPGTVSVDNAQYVSAGAVGDNLTVNGDVTGYSNTDSVSATGSAKITVSGSVTEEGECYAVKANDNGSNVTVVKNITEVGAGDAIYTSVDGKVFVGGNISESGGGDAVEAYFGSLVEVTGNVTENGEGNGIYAYGNNDTNVSVNGSVTENDAGDAIKAMNGAAVEVGSVVEKNDGDAINAQSGAAVEVGKVSEDGKGNGVSASGSNTKVTVNGGVTERGADGNAIFAGTGAEVTVKGHVSESEGGNAINATEGATVTVENYVNEDDAGNAVNAHEGANVTVKGNVNEKDDGNAIYATGAKVTIEGNVTEEGNSSAIDVSSGATVIIVGNVEEANAGDAITATANATVIVGGNVTDGVETAGDSDAVSSGFGATVIVEGLVTGQLNTNGQTNSGTIYIGELNGNTKEDADLSKIHYLIGTAANSPVKLSAVTLESDIVAAGTIDGVNEKGYKYTTTADTTDLNGKTITLKPTNVDKKLTVSGFGDADVTYKENVDGSVTFTIGDSFTGGLQNLVLTVTDKQVPEEPEPERRSYTTITIGDRDDKEETKAEETVEENPNTGAPVMNFGAVAVVLGAAFVLSKKH